MSLWENPIYRFRVPVNEETPIDLKEIVVDVTGSAPPFREPSPNLKQVLDDIFNSVAPTGVDNVLEFGAAKLKNIPYILSKGKNVCAVEFEKLAVNAMTKANLEECRKYGSRFQELIFPNPFLNDAKKFDLVLLANVLSIMPVPAERLFVLKILYDKLNAGKYLLWIAQKEGSYREVREAGRNNLRDGVWMGKGRRFKTFYRYHPVNELDEIMSLFGFEFVKRYSLSDDARLYKKIEHTLLYDMLTPEIIQQQIPSDTTITDPVSGEPKIVKNNGEHATVIPNPDALSVESLYEEKLKRLAPGTQNAEIYHRLVSNALARIFRSSLRNMDIKVQIDGGIKIIDTVFTNSATKGFFNSLRSKVDCTYPMVEAKNITGDPSNTEFDQLNGRLNDLRGHFGILVCRQIKDEVAAYKRCKTYVTNNLILFLSDNDVFELLGWARNKDEDTISDFMDRKLQSLLF
jgi:hypothetical protein